MKIGVSSYSFNQYRAKTKCNYFEICKIAKDMGFDGIEFTTLEPETPALAKEIRDYCEKIDLPITAYCVSADLSTVFGKKAVAKTKKSLEIAKILGAPIMRHDVCYFVSPFTTYQKVIARMTPRIREIAEYGKELGVRTCTENHGMYFQAPEYMKALMDSVQCDNYGWLCDIGNFLCVDAEPLPSVKVAAPYTVHVHAKDFLVSNTPKKGYFSSKGGKHLCGTILGKGRVPVAECVKALQEGGYDGFLDIEFEGQEDNITALKEGLAFLKQVLQ